eukprot:591321-Amphidinium_carterae.4
MAKRLKRVPDVGGWCSSGSQTVLLGRGYSACQVGLCSGLVRPNWQVASTRQDSEGMAAGLSTAAYKQLKLDGQSQKEDKKAALNSALGGVWHEERAAVTCSLCLPSWGHLCPVWGNCGEP